PLLHPFPPRRSSDLFLLYIVYCAVTLPVAHPPSADAVRGAMRFETAGGASLAERGVAHGDNLAADRLPPDLAHAVVAIEDQRFRSEEHTSELQSREN